MVISLHRSSLLFTLLVSLTLNSCTPLAPDRSSSSKAVSFVAHGSPKATIPLPLSRSSSSSSLSLPYWSSSRRINPRSSEAKRKARQQQQQKQEVSKINQEINKLAGELQQRKIQLSEARDRHRRLSQKLKGMIKKARRKRLYFFDTLLLKTLKYNRSHLQRIKEQMSRIDSSNDLLTAGSSWSRRKSKKPGKRITLRDFEAQHVMKEISQQNIVSDSDRILADSSKRLNLLNTVLDDMIREKNLL